LFFPTLAQYPTRRLDHSMAEPPVELALDSQTLHNDHFFIAFL
jgi:hypothetical protein